MDEPICYAKFVNKQNIRSFGNVFDLKILKQDDPKAFLESIFEDKDLVSGIPHEIFQVLKVLKTNLLLHVKDDFKKFFTTVKVGKTLTALEKSEIFNCCLKGLTEVIPRYFCGCEKNTNMFKNIIQTFVYSMKQQHIIFTPLIKKWDFSSSIWKSTDQELSRNLLYHILVWIIKNILSPMIALNFYVTICKIDSDENKLHFFSKSQWQSFYDKKISQMIVAKVLKRHEPYCFGKKTRKNCTSVKARERLNYRSVKKDIPKLHMVLKPNNDFRPIVRYKSQHQTVAEKNKIKEKLQFFKKITGTPQKKIENKFAGLHEEWLKLGKPVLYFIKTDLSNAFGSINRDKLMKMLCEKHMMYQKTEKCLYAKKKVAQQYKEIVGELRYPLLVRAGNTVYEWTEGLVQGYKYSPALSELYYTCLDQLYFSDYLQTSETGIKLFLRVVDDYLYITNSLDDAHSFLKALGNLRNVNYAKTVVNFETEDINMCEDITFLGYSYNTKTLQVSRAKNVYTGQMCYKIAFTGASRNMFKFLENRIGQSGIQINGLIFNLHYNTEQLIWKHIFTTFCLSANKFCTILAVICDQKDLAQYLSLYKKRVAVKLSNSIIETLMRNKPKDCLFVYCINHFRYLAYKALCLCAKATPKCISLVPMINKELARSNCLFGKWKEHAARIETTGEMRRKAIREVCTRTDLRAIVKQFDSLPEGFQCFHHKKLL